MWTTEHEMAAISSFGFNGRKQSYDHQVIDRVRILRGYIEAAENRADWVGIHKDACVAYAESLIHSILEA